MNTLSVSLQNSGDYYGKYFELAGNGDSGKKGTVKMFLGFSQTKKQEVHSLGKRTASFFISFAAQILNTAKGIAVLPRIFGKFILDIWSPES